MSNNYVPYHMHTEYSLLDSCTKYEDYVELAVKNGHKALSFSEHGKPLNWTEKWAACKKAGVKYLHSVEIYMTEALEPKVRDNYHTVLIARNMDGLRELNELISRSCDEDHFYYTNRISFEEFLEMSPNIISTSACLASPLNKLSDNHPMYDRLVDKYDFLEIQPHECEDQVVYNQRLLKISKEHNKLLIAGTDTHSSNKYKAECRAVLLSAKRKSYGDEDALDLTYKTYDELVEAFRKQGAIPEEEYLRAIENTNAMADMCDDIELDTKIKYPILHGSREADSKIFHDLVWNKLNEKLENGVIPAEQEQSFRMAIEEELEVFTKLNMTGFMLSMSELVGWCKDSGMAIGTARGSVGGSRVAYVTDIIDLNPETWHTVFSRFCNADREEIGDIDIDCVESDRPKIFKYIIDRFGESKTARVASFGSIQSKAVIDEIGRHLAKEWLEKHPNQQRNPWSLENISKIKSEFEKDEEKAREKYKELFYYYDGLADTKVSQSVHPAGIVISPITLRDNYGTFNKDGEPCLMLDMDNIHDYTGLAKYDFLILTTVQIVRDACNYLGRKYPRTHEINWDDEAVWNSMLRDSAGIFQFTSPFAFDSLKKFKTHSIFDMSLVTACIRPSGASYRDDLLARKEHKNPSELIDNILKDNNGYLVYQEDIIRFLQEVCGLSGSEADSTRRGIARKRTDILDKMMPRILDGYCSMSDKPREVAEEEAKEFLQIIQDASSYMFGYNHSIAYCLMGYLCAYFRYYYPLEFITSFLNNAANEEDIKTGSDYAGKVGIRVTMPKWGISRGDYAFDREKNTIAKGLSSIKYLGEKVADELFAVSAKKTCKSFIDVLYAIDRETSLDTRQLDILIKIDFFSEFGNQRELLYITDIFYNLFKKGFAKKISRNYVDGTVLEPIVKKYAVGVTKAGGEAKSYTLLDIKSLLDECEIAVKNKGLEDLDEVSKAKNFADVAGYVGYISGNDEDKKKLYVLEVYPLKRKSDGKQFGYSLTTKSIGSGKEARFSVMNGVFAKDPVKKGDVILCVSYIKEGPYFSLTNYRRIT